MEQHGSRIVLDADSSLARNVAEGDVLTFGISEKTLDGLLRKVTSKTVSDRCDRLPVVASAWR